MWWFLTVRAHATPSCTSSIDASIDEADSGSGFHCLTSYVGMRAATQQTKLAKISLWMSRIAPSLFSLATRLYLMHEHAKSSCCWN